MEIRKDQEKKTNRVAGERRADDARRIADALKRRGRISLRVHGTSMQPWMRSKDIAVIRRISIENVRCGDVVLFRRKNHLFVHRIVEKRGSLNAAQLLSKGDAHPMSDGVVQEQELLGRVMRIYGRAGGLILMPRASRHWDCSSHSSRCTAGFGIPLTG